MTEIRYGKAQVSFYRTYAKPLVVTPIPESSFTGRANILFAAEVDVDVFGETFIAAYTEGDNRNVVATDTMKNFVYAMALEYEGSTLEGFLAFLGRRFLETYPQMEALRISGREAPFVPATSVDARAKTVGPSGVLFSRSRDDTPVAEVDLAREDGMPCVTAATSGREGLQLMKVTGSSFAEFLRDDYTTLPETTDRPLFVHLDVRWRYSDLRAAIGEREDRYVHADQIRDFVHCVFHDFNSRSIQHLVHEIGRRLLERCPQLAEVSFEAQNRTWETARTSERDDKVRVFTDPHATYGRIGLVLRR
jgi:urate oxidase